MFREMRRVAKEGSREDAIAMMEKATNGVLAVNGDDGYPFAVPVSFVYKDDKIVFHCSMEGHKVDAMKKDPKVSFCVVDADNIVPERFTTMFRSAIAFGKAKLVTEGEDFMWAMKAIGEKYTPKEMDSGGFHKYMKAEDGRFQAVIIEVEHLTAKIGV